MWLVEGRACELALGLTGLVWALLFERNQYQLVSGWRWGVEMKPWL